MIMPSNPYQNVITSRLLPDTQAALLKESETHAQEAAEVLAAHGFEQEDLRYQLNPVITKTPPAYTFLDDLSIIPHGVPAVSFFSGAGGLDIGFKYAGFRNLAAVEHNRVFCDTLRLNEPTKLVIGPPEFSGDVRQFNEISTALRERLHLATPFEGVFHGGPPCQSFSMAANQRFAKGDENFKRIGFAHSDYGTLLEDYLRLIVEFRPRVFIIENVPGLKLMDGGKQLQQALLPLANHGYRITEPTVVNAANYGVPQHRHRLFVVGVRDSEHPFFFPEGDAMQSVCFSALARPLIGLPNHETRVHKTSSLLRYVRLNYGERDQQGRVDRLHPLKPSKTVIAGGLKGGGRSHLHPFIPRTLSARESARLQTFPDSYVFTGPSARQFTQIGNAVPPMLAYRLATAVYEQIYGLRAHTIAVREAKVEQLSFALEPEAIFE